jgi:iron complex outermembrane recepter protein
MLKIHSQRKASKHCLARTLLPLAAFSIAAMPLLATAQDDSDSIFEEITVTATKREQSIYEVPIAISAFTGEQIENQGISDLVDIGKFVPNLNVTTFSAGHTSSANPFIRGIGLQDHLITTDPGVGVYVDGVYLGRQVGQNWSLSNIERLEVLRGPQGTLYGRNSIGGAINIITKKPGESEGVRVGLTIGTESRLNGEFFADTRLSETLALSVSGAYKSRGGSGKYLLINNPTAQVGEIKDISARGALLWTPSDRFSLLIAADGNDGSGGMNPYTTLIDEVPTGALYQAGFRNSDISANPYNSNSGQANQVLVSNKAYGVSLTAEYDINDALTLKLIASDRHSEYRAGLDDDSLFEDFLSFPEIGVADQQSAELQLNGDYDRWDFVAGLYSFREEGSNNQNPFTFNGGAGDFLLGQKMTSLAAYANVGFHVTDKLRLAAGLRQTKDEKDATININSGLIDTFASDDWSETSWDLSATFDMNERLNVYGTIQSGYQSGQFPARPFCLFGFLDFTQPGNVSQPNCFVATDNITALNYEAGIKGLPFDNLQLSVAVFYTDYSDLPYQVSTTTGGGFDTRNVIVDQTSSGIELEGSWAIGEGFLLHSSLGYINADVKDPEAVAPLTPDLTFSLSPEYSFAIGDGDVTVRADYSYRGEMFGEPSSDPGRLTKIDSRSIVNMDIAYRPQGGEWTLALYGKNLADERYDNARLNTGDYVLRILSNDIREFGLRFIREF